MSELLSRSFSGFDWSEKQPVITLIDYIFDEYCFWYRITHEHARIREKDKIKQHLTHFILEAYKNYAALPELCMKVSLSKSYYSDVKRTRYHPKHLSYRYVVNVTNYLVDAAYFEMPLGKGEWDAIKDKRRRTRYRATQKLYALCNEFGINSFMITNYPYVTPEIIILKDKKTKECPKGKLIDYADTVFTHLSRRNLAKINDYLAKHCINLDITDTQHHDIREYLKRNPKGEGLPCVDFTQVSLRRIFNNGSFEQGGRFYGAWWQQLPSDFRIFITIEGRQTSELDYSGMHFSIMYAQAGMKLPMDDPYELEGYDVFLRGDIKKAFNTIINCSSVTLAKQAIDYHIRFGKLSKDLISGEKVIEEFIKHHPLIKDRIASGEGIKGHFIDSQIAERILLKGIENDVCILPIHDGFITATCYIDYLHQWMKEAFKEVTGQPALVKPETFKLSAIKFINPTKPYWIAYADGSVKKNGSTEGKAFSYAFGLTTRTMKEHLFLNAFRKSIRDSIDNDYKLARK